MFKVAKCHAYQSYATKWQRRRNYKSKEICITSSEIMQRGRGVKDKLGKSNINISNKINRCLLLGVINIFLWIKFCIYIYSWYLCILNLYFSFSCQMTSLIKYVYTIEGKDRREWRKWKTISILYQKWYSRIYIYQERNWTPLSWRSDII